MNIKPSAERIVELEEMAIGQIADQDHFDYHNWDGLIECDETLTDDELDWMRDNFEIVVSVVRKDTQP